MSNQKIVLDADHGRVDGAADKTAGKYRKVADEAAGVGKQMDKWGRQFAEKAAGLGAILGVIRSVGQEIERQTQAAAGANRSRGASAVTRQNSLRQLGMDQGPSGMAGAESALLNGGGGTTVEQRDSFLDQLVGAQKSSKRPIPQQNFSIAQALHNTGVFSPEELTGALGDSGKLRGLMGETSSRMAALTPEAREQLATVDYERSAGNAASERRSGRGLRARIAEQQKDSFEADNPLASGFRSIVNDATFGAVDALETSTVTGTEGGALQRDISATLRQIAATNSSMATRRPIMNTVPESGP